MSFTIKVYDNNRDYENREELTRKFIEDIYENKKKGKVTIAIGLAVFERDKDRIFKDVFVLERKRSAVFCPSVM